MDPARSTSRSGIPTSTTRQTTLYADSLTHMCPWQDVAIPARPGPRGRPPRGRRLELTRTVAEVLRQAGRDRSLEAWWGGRDLATLDAAEQRWAGPFRGAGRRHSTRGTLASAQDGTAEGATPDGRVSNFSARQQAMQRCLFARPQRRQFRSRAGRMPESWLSTTREQVWRSRLSATPGPAIAAAGHKVHPTTCSCGNQAPQAAVSQVNGPTAEPLASSHCWELV